ncbi:MAG TPA: NrfD/PsrC family molybdoenzyme membrane anchor subunit [Pirellulales bacterium]|jgi:molybdopterin-containing oxidoreductase family membrane subunit|nr:NrfD/PsrC family molybdoenzyme membrane anchor subunit [Pirellulales bacterium]
MDEQRILAPPQLPSEGLNPATPDYVARGHTMGSLTGQISDIVLVRPTGWGFLTSFGFASLLLMIFGGVIIYLLIEGIGIWGIDIPVAWSWTITDFVWWVGIGHAGTLISAILLLLHQKWRTSINRIAEAMTIFAIMCAGIFPLLHLGRPWFFYWLLPYPNTMRLWPQFRSALVWDVFAVSTYFLVSLVFWYMGMIPDLATLRDRCAPGRRRMIYGMLAMGWRNSAKHWHRYESAYLLLGGLATPLVISVHSVVSSDFAISNVPGWHETVFPPYFVAGAIFSGFAMVLLLCIAIRHIYGLKEFIKIAHLEVMGRIVLTTSLLTSFGYLSEQTLSWYGHEGAEHYTYFNRLIGWGQYAGVSWAIVWCNVLLPQILWIPKLRRNEWVLAIVSLFVLWGMWLERYLIIAQSLHHDYLPSSWGMFRPTVYDYLTYFGSIGLFGVAFLLFARTLPMLSMAELRAQLPGSLAHEEGR